LDFSLERAFGDWTRRQSAIEPHHHVPMVAEPISERQQILESILRTTRWPTKHNVASEDTEVIQPPVDMNQPCSTIVLKDPVEVITDVEEEKVITTVGPGPLLSKSLENEEWAEFLDGTLEDAIENPQTLEHRDLVAVVVAPLRNVNASPGLVERIATLLALPWAEVDREEGIDEEAIVRAYADTRVVPNLLYACKVMVQRRSGLDRSTG